MQEQIEQLKLRVASLNHRREVLEMERIRLSIEQGKLTSHHEPEYQRLGLKLLDINAECASIETRILANEARIGHLTVQAEVERLLRQPSCAARELEENRKRLEQVIARHREVAEETIRAASDEQVALDRLNGVIAAPEPQHQVRRTIEGPRRRYEGPSLSM